MAEYDFYNDKLPLRKNAALSLPNRPTIAQLRAAIAGSPQAASYPTRVLNSSTKNDLVSICRLHNIAVTTAL
jgi:hypothetical protein